MQLWIIGSNFEGEDTSRIVDDKESIEGPVLPWQMYMSCATSINNTHVILTGGNDEPRHH